MKSGQETGGQEAGSQDGLWVFPLLLVLVIVCLVLIASRFYVVAECFIGLFHAPSGIFEVPKWTTFLPHIG